MPEDFEATLFSAPSKPLTELKVKQETNSLADIITNSRTGNGADLNEFISQFPARNGIETKERMKSNNIDEFQEHQSQVVDKLECPKTENCAHEICYPPNYDVENARKNLSKRLTPREPAKVYKFDLDFFQKQAVNCIERNHSVLVSAHTSAGKTAVAEYAIAKSLKEKTRVIYTSPIKALSNQKYRDLYEEFEDVGLITGDTRIKEKSQCLVMTTEILRNMIYRGDEIIREVSWVIFDEIHYMKDKSRGVIYEECIILLPNITRFVFLSATIPNAAEFGCWVAKMNNSPCNVIYTENRPVPLKHYVCPKGSKGLTLILDEKKNFFMKNYENALSQMINDSRDKVYGNRKRKWSEEQDLLKVMKLIMNNRNYPAIVFAFSRRECETNALLMTKLDFNCEQEKTSIEMIFTNAIESLSNEDQKLPQVSSILPLLKRGIGIHHSGLLPIIKEVIEILFQEGLIKALFATETFSMGINMPAKTVIFSSLKKFDGKENRFVSSGEYIQMSGRAGRRGIDENGLIVLLLNQRVESVVAHKILTGRPDALDSSFHLGYNMLLNLMRLEGSDPEFMISHSFYHFQQIKKALHVRKELDNMMSKYVSYKFENEKDLREFYHIKERYDDLKIKIKSTINKPSNIVPYLNDGRLVKMADKKNDWGWGVIIDLDKVNSNNIPKNAVLEELGQKPRFRFLVKVFIVFRADKIEVSKIPAPVRRKEFKEYLGKPLLDTKFSCGVFSYSLEKIDEISSIRVILPSNVSSSEGKSALLTSLYQVFAAYPEEIPLLDPIKNMNIKGRSFKDTLAKFEVSKKRMSDELKEKSESFVADYERFAEKLFLEKEIDAREKALTEVKTSQKIRSILHSMRDVLKTLEYITPENVVNIKGRVACEISTCDELLATELLLGGSFKGLSCEQIVAVSSCLVNTEKEMRRKDLRPELLYPFKDLQKHARRIGKVMMNCGVEVDPSDYVAGFQPTLMGVAAAWCRGARFVEICGLTSVFEGAIIRVMRRLGELLGEFVLACKTIGDQELAAKFQECIKLIKRDIIFAASLYL